MTTHRFILEPYKGIATRHTCPICQRKRCFSRYIDTEKRISFPNHVGRCDHEQKCGYHFTPREFFDQNPMERKNLMEETTLRPYTKAQTAIAVPTSYIDRNIVRQSLKCYNTNKLYLFLASQLGVSSAMTLMERYQIGSSKHWDGATVFWQIDHKNRVRTGKIMLYNAETGKRVKEPYNYVTWVHSVLHKGDYNLKQCFFGEHLLATDKTRPVALVESEKTALIASYYLPQYLWLASGGKNGCFNENSLSVLAGRNVVLFPNLGATEYWQGKIGVMKSIGIDVQLFDYLEANAPPEERKEGYDIADYLLKIEIADGKARIGTGKCAPLPMKKQVLGIPKLPVSETDRRARKPGLFKGSKFMSVYYISRQLVPPRSPVERLLKVTRLTTKN